MIDPALSDLGKTPIPGDAPAGADARYDPDYEAMQAEIDKLSNPAAGGTTDWDKAAQLARRILSGKSKDLLAAAYLSEGLSRSDKLEGLAAGTHVLKDMALTYWETLFPAKKRMRGRVNALSWWLDRARGFLETYEPDSPPPKDLVDGLAKDVDELDAFLSENAEDAPNLRPLSEALSRLPTAAPEPAPAESQSPPPPESPAADASQAAAPPPPPPPATPAAAPPPPAASPTAAGGDPKALLSAGLDQLFTASYPLFVQDPAHPLPYRLVRLAAWLPLAGPPPATAGRTLLPPPDDRIKPSVERLLEAGNARGALEASETRLVANRFLLDLNRLTAQALARAEDLGQGRLAALDAVETETALFVRRFPGIENLAFSNGAPFADEKTKTWLSGLGRKDSGGGGPASPEAEVAAVTEQARLLAGQNQALQAVVLLQEKLEAAKSGRLRLLWRISLAEILLAAGSPDAARPMIGQILADIDAHKLEDFDPDLALRGLTAARRGLAPANDDAGKALAREVLTRIMRVNPAEGLRQSGIA